MAALTAVVVALSIAVAANFLLLMAIVRRLRVRQPAQPVVGLPRVGMQAPHLALQDSEGRPIGDGFYTDHPEAVVAFFTDNCLPCQQVKAELVRDPIEAPLLAFVQPANGSREQNEFAAELVSVGARTVLLEPESDIPKRFSVSAFPTLLRLRGGIVVAASVKVAEVRQSVGERDASVQPAWIQVARSVVEADGLSNQ